MPVTYAGVGLTPPFDAQAAVNNLWHAHRIEEFDYPAYYTRWIDHLPIPQSPKRDAPRIGVLRWPTGASQWATCHLVATGEQLASVRSALGSLDVADLVISDGTDEVTAEMYLLPPRPILQKDEGELYLLTLVDERWFWWTQGDETAPIDAPESWSNLFESLFGSLGVSYSLDSVPSGYSVPSPIRWTVGAKPFPLLIDAAAMVVGMRVVRQLDGIVTVQSSANADISDSTSWETYKYLVLTGGRILEADVARQVPGSCSVVFWGYDPVIVNKTLSSLSLPKYAAFSGVAGWYAQVVADLPATTEASIRNNYATQAATDYYNWIPSRSDYTLRGIQPRELNGNDQCMEWVHVPDQIVTRVIRSTFGDNNVYGDAPPQRMFPVEITSTYDETTGYSWTRLTLNTDTPGYEVQNIPKTGDMLFDVADNQDLQVGDRVLVWSNPDGAGWEFDSGTGGGGGFFARLTEYDSGVGRWKYVALTLNDAGVYVDSGSESDDFVAAPLKTNGTSFGTGFVVQPYSGLRVWMIPSRDSSFYEFMPIDRYSFHAQITAVNVYGKCKWKAVFLDSSGNVSYGPESDDYSAVDIGYGGGTLDVTYFPPQVGLNVVMFQDDTLKAADDTIQYRFTAIPVAGAGIGGVLTERFQYISGSKAFLQISYHLGGLRADNLCPGYGSTYPAIWVYNASSGLSGGIGAHRDCFGTDVLRIGAAPDGQFPPGQYTTDVGISSVGQSFVRSQLFAIGAGDKYTFPGQTTTFRDLDGRTHTVLGGIIINTDDPWVLTGDPCECDGTGTGSGTGGGGGCAVGDVEATIAGTGSGTGTTSATATITGVSVPECSTLIVVVGMWADAGAVGTDGPSFNGSPMSYLGLEASSGGAPNYGAFVFYYRTGVVPFVGDVSVLVNGVGSGSTVALLSARVVSGVGAELDTSAGDIGAASDPDSGTTGTSSTADTYVLGAALHDGTGGVWQNGFANEQSVTAGGVVLRTGYQIPGSVGTFDALLHFAGGDSPPPPANWACVCGVVK